MQREALDALADTRADGNAAGLVVLATGMGKTFLGAFDSAEFSRVLFVAHREEILKQARRTFRRVRPRASLGFYHGGEKSPGADILFASVQTLAQPGHLAAFAPDAFDYLIVDEFHHAHADTYRRLLDYFEPRFLLGLTATPERTDGGDLLALCGENVVYRADLFEGIERGRLSPFDYFGVPDPVEYDNIPWRRLSEEELTGLVATEARAENAFEQLQQRGGRRVLAFCVSIRHAEFMRRFFAERGLRAVAVHSGAESAPREEAIELLEKGELDVVVTVDMFNEGVDIPAVDTVLMLRPTDSKVVWLQQLGRGLRKQAGKRLSVIDYVGNHRAFLRHLQTLFQLDGSVLNARKVRCGVARGGRTERAARRLLRHVRAASAGAARPGGARAAQGRCVPRLARRLPRAERAATARGRGVPRGLRSAGAAACVAAVVCGLAGIGSAVRGGERRWPARLRSCSSCCRPRR